MLPLLLLLLLLLLLRSMAGGPAVRASKLVPSCSALASAKDLQPKPAQRFVVVLRCSSEDAWTSSLASGRHDTDVASM